MIEIEREPMVIDDTLFQEFRQRYGTIAGDLIIFYHQLLQYGDNFVRAWYPQATYYRYRNALISGGYLYLIDFKS